MKLNGWHRIAFVLFLLWALGISIFMWSEVLNNARSSADFARKLCASENEAKQIKDDCWKVYEKSYEESKQSIIDDALGESWWITPAIILTPPILIIIIWLFSYGVTKVFHWIRAGFSKAPFSTTPLKQSFILTAGIILLLVVLFTLLHFTHVSREKAFQTTLAECKLEVVKLKFDDAEAEKYLPACMATKGYKFISYRDACSYGIFSMEVQLCYD